MKKALPYRPQGQITRGKTARNRLRRSDIFMLLTEEQLIRQKDLPGNHAFYVDLGYGFEPFTTLESADRLRGCNPRLSVLGVEIEPERVNAAKPFENENTFFRLGGFNLPLQQGESVRLIRAFNVLRQYDESQSPAALQLLGSQLMPGGLLLEGTSNPSGSVWTANLVRRGMVPPFDVIQEGFLFSTNFHMGFSPDLFQPVLTKNYIHCMRPGERIWEFMECWKNACCTLAPLRTYGLRQLFKASAYEVARKGFQIDLRARLLNRGFFLWKY